MQYLTYSIYTQVQYLMKLNISHININDPETVDNILTLMSSKWAKFVQHIDLSWCCLSSKHLALIVADLRYYCLDNMRSLNLSYNQLNFSKQQKDTDEYEASIQFMIYFL